MQGCLARKAGLSGLLLASLACAPRPPAAVTPSSGGRTITLAELQQSLASQRPCTVVFDIDDTGSFEAP